MDVDDQGEFLASLRGNIRDVVFMGANAGQHRAKIRHEFRDLEDKLASDPNLKNHYLQKEMQELSIDPLSLPRYSASSWLNTTNAMIAVGLPPGVSQYVLQFYQSKSLTRKLVTFLTWLLYLQSHR